VAVGLANEGNILLPVNVVEKWEPTKKVSFGGVTYFSVDGTYYSMKNDDFNRIFVR